MIGLVCANSRNFQVFTYSLGNVAHMSEADTVAKEHCQRNEARKPKDHRHGLGSKKAELVANCRIRELPCCQDEVGQ